MTKSFRAFRFDPTLYSKFKELTRANNLMVTEAFEKFMALSVQAGAIVWPEPVDLKRQAGLEAEARVLLDWLGKGRFWISDDEGKQISVIAHLFRLLTKIQNEELRQKIENQLKNSMKKA